MNTSTASGPGACSLRKNSVTPWARHRGTVWILLCLPIAVLGWVLLWTYQVTPGPAGLPAAVWPNHATLARNMQQPTLLVFAHPRCPCTRATLGELALIMARCHEQVDARILFYKPAGSDATWEQTDLWHAALAIPGLQVAIDLDAAEAKRFGVATSGTTLLYAQDGKRLFSGGITRSRGHSGDNPGRSAVISLLTTRKAACSETPVFGCALFEK